MALRIVVLVLLLQCVCSKKPYTVINGKPDFCLRPCPTFTVLPSNSTVYETRQYGPETWIANDINVYYNTPLNLEIKKALLYPLHEYTRHTGIPVSSPLVLKSYASKSKFTMMAYVPKFYNTRLLQNAPSVYVDSKPKFTAYVRSFTGNPNSNNKWAYEANILKEALIKDKKPVKRESFYAAIYDSRPWLTWTLHNELWFIAADKNETANETALP